MKLVFGDVWGVAGSFSAICILTNGIIKNNGELVMGKGLALEASQRFPQLPRVIGSFVKQYGNRVFNLGKDESTGIRLISFPTKHDWKDASNLELIAQSCIQLVELVNKNNWELILLPRPGVGLGNLKWSDVEGILGNYLDDRFYIISNNPNDLTVPTPPPVYENKPVIKPIPVSNPVPSAIDTLKEMVASDEFPQIEDNTDEIIQGDVVVNNHIKTVCVTGHRPKDLWGYNSSAKYQQLQNKMYYCLKQFHDTYGVKNFISGGAQGVDQLFYWVCNHVLKEYPECTNTLSIPFKGQEDMWVEEGKFGKTEYRQMLNSASSVVVVNPVVTPQSPKEHIVKALMDRNAHMVSNSDFVLGIYKGDIADITSTTRIFGGTLNALRLAYKMKKCIVVINPFTLATTRFNF